MPEKYILVDGVPTLVHHVGTTTLPDLPPDLERGEAVVCLHGAGGNGGYLRPLLDALGTRHSPLSFDQPGHGRSGGLDSLGSIERMAAFTWALLGKLGIGAPVLLGHSMGGAIALRCALDHPGEVRALVLCGSGARLPLAAAAIDETRRVTQGRVRRSFTRDAYSPQTPDEIVRRGWMEDAKTDPRAVLGDLTACAAWDASGRLSEIRCPTLVTVGEDERPALLEESDRLAAGIRGARRETVPAAGHALPLERPAELAASVERFLSEALP